MVLQNDHIWVFLSPGTNKGNMKVFSPSTLSPNMVILDNPTRREPSKITLNYNYSYLSPGAYLNPNRQRPWILDFERQNHRDMWPSSGAEVFCDPPNSKKS